MADAVIVGTGPNGLAAAVTLLRAGLSVELHEAHHTVGGGLRTEPLFDSDVVHDICSAVHPMAAASRFFREFDLAARGVDLLQPEVPYAHPLLGQDTVLAHRDLAETSASLGEDGARWKRLMAPLVAHSQGVVDLILSGQRSIPDDLVAPLLLAPRVLAHATRLPFATERAGALLTGVAAHAVGRLPSFAASAVSLLLGHLAHASGWPLPRGGSASIAEALVADIVAHGGRIHTGRMIKDLRELGDAPLLLLDVSPKGLLQLAGDRLPGAYRRALERFRYGAAVSKADFLVSGPIPWSDPETGRAGTVHLGGTRADMYRTESAAVRGIQDPEPFVLLVDPAVTDPGREAAGRRPVWAYAHVPQGDPRDPVDLVTRRIEQYAPGFRDTVVAARGTSGVQYEMYNPNYVGGDIGAGAMTLRQSVLRPVAKWDPYRVPLPGVYLCSASTPPGPSVHGMSGHLAALSALRHEHGIRVPPPLGPRT
ncbi:NAD(P)/FAD-dependent oxidoreductase [Streptomyces albidoflavus]